MNEPMDPSDPQWERQVADYLLAHPEFFERHLDVLERLRLPHPCRPAISLLERQLARLQEQNRGLRERLQELVRIARDNDCLSERMQNLHRVLIEARHLDELLLGVQVVLRDEFAADCTALRLVAGVGGREPGEHERLAPAALDLCREQMRQRKPWCGRPGSQLVRSLFEADAEVASVALVPLLSGGDWLGVLAIGSRDPERFHPGAGTVFLSRLGELVAYALNLHLYPAGSTGS
ncbi:MAG: DUF484 family protein [Candidatus Competibacterales bacterium]|nr:DUF484 family protein [Candidatus Competibacterales bacterium]